MKVLKRRFGLSKEEIQENIRLFAFHKLYLKAQDEIEVIKTNRDLRTPEKLRKIQEIRNKLRRERKRHG